MDENDEEHKEITVIHQICDLPLYHTKYHVVVSKNPILAKEHIEDLYPGIIMNFNKHTLSYTCTIRHDEIGDALLVYIKINGGDPNQPIESIVAHEAVNLGWVLTDELNVKVDSTNYVTQAYIVSDIVKNVTNVIQQFEEENTGIDDL